MTFSYIDGDDYVFMDSEDYSPYSFNKDVVADELLFISEDTQDLQVIMVNKAPVALDLPSIVELTIVKLTIVKLTIVETDPSLKGGSAAARSKSAF